MVRKELAPGVATGLAWTPAGQITLTGLVLTVGGIREKLLAAQRAGMKRVIMPKRNEKDLADLPAPLREDLELVFAERIDQVLAAALTGPPPAVGV